MNSPLKCDKNSDYYSLFNWELLSSLENIHIVKLAETFCTAVKLFNGITKSYEELYISKKEDAKRILELSDKLKVNSCKQCKNLQQQIDIQNTKFKQLASVFGEIINVNNQPPSTSRSKEISCQMTLEKAHDIYTQIIDGDQNIPQKTPPDRVKKRKKTDSSDDELDFKSSPFSNKSLEKHATPGKLSQENQPTKIINKINFEKSPILGKSKFSRNYIDEASPICQEIYSNETTIPKIPSEKDQTILNTSTPIKIPNSSTESKKKKHSISLLKNPPIESISPLKVIKGKAQPGSAKKLKQARLTFNNVKEKLPLDVTRLDEFCGGMRSFSGESPNILMKEDKLLQTAIQLSLKEADRRPSEDDDVIIESPCDQGSKFGIKKLKNIEKQSNLTKNEKENPVFPSDDETMYFPTDDDHFMKNTSVLSEKNVKKCDNIDIVKNKDKAVPVNNCDQEEKKVKKKIIKKPKLPGWSCKDCKNFYEVAFKNNEKVLRAKMEECLKHKNRFNTIKSNTPPGFWDVAMPPTQPTEIIQTKK